jgi:Zn-dependent protease with chaperone function
VQTDQGTTRCPQCAQQIPVDPQYVTWCDKCDWNVDPTGAAEHVPAWRQRLEHRLAETMYRELEHGRIQRPGWDAARVVTYLLSAVILLLPLAGLLGGIALLVFYRPLWVCILFSIIPFGFALLFRPRAHRLDLDTHLVSREQAPLLFALLDRIATSIGTRPAQFVALEAEPNVYYMRVGWRFRPVIGIGLSLWAGLRPQERVAVLAHEFGHGKNGDARYGWVVNSAMTILNEIQLTFSQQPLDVFRQELIYYTQADPTASIVNRFLNATLGGAARAIQWVLTMVGLRGRQRAEYLADRRASEIAGTDAMAWALERTLLAETSYRAMESALRFGSEVGPLEAAGRAVSQISARELERRLRVSRLRETRSDSTHPPTNLRTKLIRARPPQHALVVLGTDESRAIDRELAEPGEAVLKELRSELR